MTVEHGDALIVGASRGVGLALAEALAARQDAYRRLFVTHRGDTLPDSIAALEAQTSAEVVPLRCDVTDDGDLETLGSTLASRGARLTLTIHAAGILHEQGLRPEKALHQVNRSSLQRVFDVNAFSPLLVARTVLGQHPRNSPSHFAALSAMVGSIADNRIGGWYAYRASKAALNQLLRTLAIEGRRTHPGLCVTAIHPGTTDTELSKPFQGNVPEGKLYKPATSAARILAVVEAGVPAASGRFMNWDGKPIPW